MKRSTAFVLPLALAASFTLRAADEPSPSPPPRNPSREELRKQLQDLTPEERQARIREFRERQGLAPLRPGFEMRREELQKLSPQERQARLKEWREKGGAFRDELEARREELKGLSPEEREARIKEWREKGIGGQPGFPSLTPEQREARRKVIRERLDKQLNDLRKKKADGNLADEDRQRLERLEEIAKRFETGRGPLPPK